MAALREAHPDGRGPEDGGWAVFKGTPLTSQADTALRKPALPSATLLTKQ